MCRASQPVLYRAVFHGGMRSMWSSLMEEPAGRQLAECVTQHDQCVEHSVLAAAL